MRFLFGFGVGLLLPMAVKALMNTNRPVVLESIRGGLAPSAIPDNAQAQVKAGSTAGPTESRPEAESQTGEAEENKP